MSNQKPKYTSDGPRLRVGKQYAEKKINPGFGCYFYLLPHDDGVDVLTVPVLGAWPPWLVWCFRDFHLTWRICLILFFCCYLLTLTLFLPHYRDMCLILRCLEQERAIKRGKRLKAHLCIAWKLWRVTLTRPYSIQPSIYYRVLDKLTSFDSLPTAARDPNEVLTFLFSNSEGAGDVRKPAFTVISQVFHLFPSVIAPE